MTRRERRTLSVPLNEDEKIAAGERLARLASEIGQLEEELSAIKKDFSARIKEKENEQTPLIHQLTTGMRLEEDAVCTWHYDHEHMTKTLIDPRGVVLEERRLTELELQTSIEDEIEALTREPSDGLSDLIIPPDEGDDDTTTNDDN